MMSWEDNPVRSGVVGRFGKIQKATFSPSTSLSTALKPFPLFTVSHGFLPNSNSSLICASKNTDAPFGAELSLYMIPREAILALPSELINSLLDQEKRLDAAMCIVCSVLRLC